jgi:hypothetical protein
MLPGVKPGATIIAEAIGGKGGRGQDGGNGGAGGAPNKVHPAANGGSGGAAGPGGRGGDAGVVHAFIVLAQADMSKADEFIKSVTLNANVAPGSGGAPGDPGGGGTWRRRKRLLPRTRLHCKLRFSWSNRSTRSNGRRPSTRQYYAKMG